MRERNRNPVRTLLSSGRESKIQTISRRKARLVREKIGSVLRGNVSIFINQRIPEARHIAERIKKFLKREGISVKIEKVDKNTFLVVACGGDGTILRSTRSLASYNPLVVGVNTGKEGVLAALSRKNFIPGLKKILQGEAPTFDRMMLEVEYAQKRYFCLNDAVIRTGRIVRLCNIEFGIDNRKIFSFQGDGIICSTPTGSTAYGLASGGPVCQPSMKAVILIPLSAWQPHIPPLIISEFGKIYLKPEAKREGLLLCLDGQIHLNIRSGRKVYIKRASRTVKLVGKEELGRFFKS